MKPQIEAISKNEQRTIIMDKEDLLYKFLSESLEDECLIVGEDTLRQLIKDTLSKKDNKEGVIQNYITPDIGYNISIYEAVILVFAAIQAIDAIINIIKKLRSKNVDNEKLIESTKQLLSETSIPEHFQ